MTTLDHVNTRFFRQTENTLTLIDVDKILLLDYDFNGFDVLELKVGLLKSLFHNLLDFELF